MNHTSFFEKVKCIVSNECNSNIEHTEKIGQEETQTEITEAGFHAFDMDAVFAN